MSEHSHISVSSTESSPAPSSAPLPEVDPAWNPPHPPTPNPAYEYIQQRIAEWIGDQNPRPTSEEVRQFIRDSGAIHGDLLEFHHYAAPALLEVSVSLNDGLFQC